MINKSTSATLQPSIHAVLVTTPLILDDAGYDSMGAKLYRKSGLANASPTTLAANALKPNTSYKFVINAALEEKINNNWQAVNHKNTTTPVTQFKNLFFKTNSESVGGYNTASSNTTISNTAVIAH
jgi:hypothetical protein